MRRTLPIEKQLLPELVKNTNSFLEPNHNEEKSLEKQLNELKVFTWIVFNTYRESSEEHLDHRLKLGKKEKHPYKGAYKSRQEILNLMILGHYKILYIRKLASQGVRFALSLIPRELEEIASKSWAPNAPRLCEILLESQIYLHGGYSLREYTPQGDVEAVYNEKFKPTVDGLKEECERIKSLNNKSVLGDGIFFGISIYAINRRDYCRKLRRIIDYLEMFSPDNLYNFMYTSESIEDVIFIPPSEPSFTDPDRLNYYLPYNVVKNLDVYKDQFFERMREEVKEAEDSINAKNMKKLYGGRVVDILNGNRICWNIVREAVTSILEPYLEKTYQIYYKENRLDRKLGDWPEEKQGLSL